MDIITRIWNTIVIRSKWNNRIWEQQTKQIQNNTPNPRNLIITNKNKILFPHKIIIASLIISFLLTPAVIQALSARLVIIAYARIKINFFLIFLLKKMDQNSRKGKDLLVLLIIKIF